MSIRQIVGYGLVVLLSTVAVGSLLLRDAPWTTLWTVAALGAIAAVALIYILHRRQESVLTHAAETLRRLADGKFGHKLYAVGSPALEDLAHSMNSAGEELEGRVSRLEADRRQLRAVLSGMVEGVVSLDAEQCIVFANERAGEFLDFDPAHAAGKKFWEVVRHRRLQEIARDTLSTLNPIREELDWTGRTPRHLALYASRLSGGDSLGAVLVLHDTSELLRLERIRQEFVANVSHELKTPLAVIKVSVETLLNGAASDPNHRTGFLEQIDEQADRLHALILDLLDLARIESDTKSLHFSDVAVHEVVCDCIERHRTRAEAKGQSLLTPAPSAPALTAWADEEALGIILDNLVDNAIKYTPDGGRVTLRWTKNDSHIGIEVEDTGIGIPSQDQARVFERFYRVDRARSRELGGTGLGLSIVKHLAQAMGGSVGVRSTPGKGATFCVHLPVGPLTSCAAQEEPRTK